MSSELYMQVRLPGRFLVCTKDNVFFASVGYNSRLLFVAFRKNNDCSDEEWSDDEKGEGGKEGAKDDLEELDEMQLGELLAREQRARHMGLSQVRCCFALNNPIV